MRVKEYPLMLEAVEDGVEYGVRRFFKHKDRYEMPEAEIHDMVDAIRSAVMSEINDRFIFDDGIYDA